jgi:hypothetical protein
MGIIGLKKEKNTTKEHKPFQVQQVNRHSITGCI